MWREADDDFSGIQLPLSFSGDCLSAKTEKHVNVVNSLIERRNQAAFLDPYRETDDGVSDTQWPASFCTQTTQLDEGEYDGEYDDIILHDDSDAMAISDADLKLLRYQETQQDEIEDHNLECDIMDDLDHSMADIHEGVISYEDYIAQDIIQQFRSDMEEQLSSSALGATSTESTSYQTVSWLDCQAYLQETCGRKHNSLETTSSAASFHPSRSLNSRLRRQASLAMARSLRSSQGSAASRVSEDSVVTQVAYQHGLASNYARSSHNSLDHSREKQNDLGCPQADGLAATPRPVVAKLTFMSALDGFSP